MMSRYTVTNLRKDVYRYNDYLADINCLTRIEVGARNGYQTVDEYSVHSDGSRKGSGVNRNRLRAFNGLHQPVPPTVF